MMRRAICLLTAVCLFASCGLNSDGSKDASALEEDSVSGLEMPAGVPLALDSINSVHAVEHGLQLEDGLYQRSGGEIVVSFHKFTLGDTAFFTPVVKGYGAMDGKVAVSSSWKVYNASGKLVGKDETGKTVSRFPEQTASYAHFRMPISKLDSMDNSTAHYDVRYELKDRITGKSLEGMYRIRVDRSR